MRHCFFLGITTPWPAKHCSLSPLPVVAGAFLPELSAHRKYLRPLRQLLLAGSGLFQLLVPGRLSCLNHPGRLFPHVMSDHCRLSRPLPFACCCFCRQEAIAAFINRVFSGSRLFLPLIASIARQHYALLSSASSFLFFRKPSAGCRLSSPGQKAASCCFFRFFFSLLQAAAGCLPDAPRLVGGFMVSLFALFVQNRFSAASFSAQALRLRSSSALAIPPPLAGRFVRLASACIRSVFAGFSHCFALFLS